jgi:hypothetical protein
MNSVMTKWGPYSEPWGVPKNDQFMSSSAAVYAAMMPDWNPAGWHLPEGHLTEGRNEQTGVEGKWWGDLAAIIVAGQACRERAP